MPPPKEKKLTPKERGLIKGLIQGQSITQSAKNAGYSERSAHELGSRALKKVEVQKALMNAMRKAGLDEDSLVQTLKDGLNATDPKGNKDFTNRHRYLDTALKVRGDYAPEKHEIGVGTLADLFKRMEEGGG